MGNPSKSPSPPEDPNLPSGEVVEVEEVGEVTCSTLVACLRSCDRALSPRLSLSGQVSVVAVEAVDPTLTSRVGTGPAPTGASDWPV